MLKIASILGLLGVFAVSNQQLLAAASAQPNFVVIMCDDLGWGDVGFNGGTTIQTPHLDEMVKAFAIWRSSCSASGEGEDYD